MRYNINYIFRRVLTFFIIFVILSFAKSCEVHAMAETYVGQLRTNDFIGSNGVLEWTSDGNQSYSVKTLLYNSQYDYPYVNAFTTATYGGAFYGFTNVVMIPNRVYNVTYALSRDNGCKIPGAFDVHFKVTLGSIGQWTRATIKTANVANGVVIWGDNQDSFNACIYNVSFTVSEQSTFMVLPFTSINTVSIPWVFYGYNITDFGNASELTTATINSMQQNIINSIVTNQNINQQQTNDKLDDINDSINDDSTPSNSDFNNAIEDVEDALPTNSTISSLVTMPITFLQKIIDALNGTCQPIVIGELYSYNMTMPCINPSDYVGIIWNIVDVICAGFFAYFFGKRLVVIFHNVTSMKEGGLKEAYD